MEGEGSWIGVAGLWSRYTAMDSGVSILSKSGVPEIFALTVSGLSQLYLRFY